MEQSAALDYEMPRATLLRRILTYVLKFFCCGWDGSSSTRREQFYESGAEAPVRSRPVRSRPLQDVAEGSSLLEARSSEDCRRLTARMSPQERQFKAMKKPSFTTKPFKGKSIDDESCLICLEEFTDDNPRILLACSHGFHLGCMLEWQERGKTECPVCDITVSPQLSAFKTSCWRSSGGLKGCTCSSHACMFAQ